MWKPPNDTQDMLRRLNASCLYNNEMTQEDFVNMNTINIRNCEQYEDFIWQLAKADYSVAIEICRALAIVRSELFYKFAKAYDISKSKGGYRL